MQHNDHPSQEEKQTFDTKLLQLQEELQSFETNVTTKYKWLGNTTNQLQEEKQTCWMKVIVKRREASFEMRLQNTKTARQYNEIMQH